MNEQDEDEGESSRLINNMLTMLILTICTDLVGIVGTSPSVRLRK